MTSTKVFKCYKAGGLGRQVSAKKLEVNQSPTSEQVMISSLNGAQTGPKIFAHVKKRLNISLAMALIIKKIRLKFAKLEKIWKNITCESSYILRLINVRNLKKLLRRVLIRYSKKYFRGSKIEKTLSRSQKRGRYSSVETVI